jgi:hypothetical protein
MTYAEEIAAFAAKGLGPGSPHAQIIAVVIGLHYTSGGDARGIPEDRLCKLLLWDEARPLLDYEYDRGYGLSDCHPIVAWTDLLIVFTTVYDGATGFGAVPRNPIPWIPVHHGGE